MNSIPADFSLIVVINVGFILASFFAGHFAARAMKHELASNVQGLFYKLLIGVSLIITGYALLVTGGKSVFLGAIIIPIHFLIAKYRSGNQARPPVSPSSIKGWYWICFLAVVVVACSYKYFVFYYDFANQTFHTPKTDDFVYAQLAAALGVTGIESDYSPIALFAPGFDGVTPYHYYNLYPASFISTVTGLPAIKAYLCVVKPFFIFISFLGYLSIYEKVRGSISPSGLILSFLALFFGGFFLNQAYIVSIWGNLGMFIQTVLTFKIEFYAPFVMAGFLALANKKFDYAVYGLVFLMMANFAFVPAAFCGGVGCAAIAVMTRRVSFREIWFVMAPFIIFTGFFLVFYSFFGLDLIKGTISVTNIIGSWSFKTVQSMLVDNVIKLCLLYFPFLLLLFFSWRRGLTNEKMTALIFAGITICAGLAMWAVNHYFYNAFQFSTLITALLLNVGCFFLTIELIEKGSPSVQKLSAFFFVTCCLLSILNLKAINFYVPNRANVEKEFLGKISAIDNDRKLKKGLVFEHYKEGDIKSILMSRDMAGTYLPLVSDRFIFIPYFTNLETETIRQDASWGYQLSPFYSFAAERSLNKDDALERFIAERDIDFIVMKSGTAIPARLESRVLKRIESQNAGEVFLLLRKH